ncbi:hypothetical protein I9Y15_004442 [Serratia marcescens]|nr:hypothetical protein [Serratia marcescens]
MYTHRHPRATDKKSSGESAQLNTRDSTEREAKKTTLGNIFSSSNTNRSRPERMLEPRTIRSIGSTTSQQQTILPSTGSRNSPISECFGQLKTAYLNKAKCGHLLEGLANEEWVPRNSKEVAIVCNLITRIIRERLHVERSAFSPLLAQTYGMQVRTGNRSPPLRALSPVEGKATLLANACSTLLRTIQDTVKDANSQGIANLGNFLKTLLTVPPAGVDTGALVGACQALLAAIPGAVGTANSQHVANLGNFLKTLLAAPPTGGETEALVGACQALLAAIPGAVGTANSQEIASLGNFLTTLLAGSPAGGETKAQAGACQALLAAIPSVVGTANSQGIANLGNFLTTLLAAPPAGGAAGAMVGVCQALLAAIPGAVGTANSQGIANLGNFLKTLLAGSPAGDETKAEAGACQALLAAIPGAAGTANSQGIANLGNFLTTLLAARPAGGETEALVGACQALLAAIPGVVGTANSQDIANLGNFLKTLLASPPAGDETEALAGACQALLAVIPGVVGTANSQEIASLGNFLKTLLTSPPAGGEAGALAGACQALLAAIPDTLGAANIQHIANLGNFLKTLLAAPSAGDETGALAGACQTLLTAIPGGLGAANSQHIANLGNFLTTLLAAPPAGGKTGALAGACQALLAAIPDTLGTANSRHIANLGNFLTTLLVAPPAGGKAGALAGACQSLLAAIPDTLGAANSQDIASLGNFLKTLLAAPPAGDETEALVGACQALLAAIPGGLGTANSQDIASLGNLLKTLLAAPPAGIEAGALTNACNALLAMISRGKVQGNGSYVDDIYTFVIHMALHDDESKKAVNALFDMFTGGHIEALNFKNNSRVLKILRLTNLHDLFTPEHGSRFYKHYTQQDVVNGMAEQGKANILVLTGILQHKGVLTNEQGKVLRDQMRIDGKISPETAIILLENSHWLYRFAKGEEREFLEQQFEQVLHAIHLKNTSPPAEQRIMLRKLALQLHKLKLVFNRSRKKVRQGINVLDSKIIQTAQMLHAVINDTFNMSGKCDITGFEVELFRRYTPDHFMMPEHYHLSDEEEDKIAKNAYRCLSMKPKAIISSRQSLHAVTLTGHPLSKDESLVIQGSIYQSLFGSALGFPILIKPQKGERAINWPAFTKFQGTWYRSDMLRGGLNKPSEALSGKLLGLPLTAANFFSRYWFTSTESRNYGVRAFFPNKWSEQSVPPPQAGLEGCFHMAIIPDVNSQKYFCLKGSYGETFQIKDGCGFIRGDMASDLMLNIKKPKNTPTKGHLPLQALIHYKPDTPQQKEQIVGEFLQSAKINKSLRDACIEGKHSTPSYNEITTGNPFVYTATTIPAVGEKMILGSAPEWLSLAHQMLVIGRPPYDTRNLIPVDENDIITTPIMNDLHAIQYSLSGFSKNSETPEDERLIARFFKGLLLVIPKASWPDGFEKTPIAVSTKDQKLCSLFQSHEDKKRMQTCNHVERIELHGALESKDVRTSLVGVPPQRQDELSGDFDGDIVQIWLAKDFPETVNLIRKQNETRLPNPKMPKSFTRDIGSNLEMGKLIELQSNMLAGSATIANRYYALPDEAQRELIKAQASTELLEQVFGHGQDGWELEAGLPTDFYTRSVEVQQQLLVEREIGVLMKIGTDLEKTEFNSLFEQANERRESYMRTFTTISKTFSIPQGEPFGKSLLRKLGGAPDSGTLLSSDELRTLLEDTLTKTTYFGGLANAILKKIIEWRLGK